MKVGVDAACAIRRAIVACVDVSATVSDLALGSARAEARRGWSPAAASTSSTCDPAARAASFELVERDAELDGAAARDRRAGAGGAPVGARRPGGAWAPAAVALGLGAGAMRRRRRGSRSLADARGRPRGRGCSRSRRRSRPRRRRSPCRSRSRPAARRARTIARVLQPAQDHGVLHRVGQLRHGELARQSVLELAERARLGERRGEAALLHLGRAAPRPTASISSSAAAPTPSTSRRARRTTSGSRSRQRSSSPSGRYLPGSLREWPTKRYVIASTKNGPPPERAWSTARRAVSRTVQTLHPVDRLGRAPPSPRRARGSGRRSRPRTACTRRSRCSRRRARAGGSSTLQKLRHSKK